MPIQSINDNQRMPILGKIRLGIKKVAQSGKQYPDEVEYFVLKDAPEVEKVYGAEPKEIDVVFLSDSLDEIIPTWLKWYAGGFMDKEGNFTGGKIQCRGTGPDKKGNPGVAEFFAKKDPVTRLVPTRPCLGDRCPDWKDSRGRSQCKQAMNVLAMIPRVSMYGVYQIDTTSWNSIRSFHDQLSFVKQLNNGVLRGVPFKIARELMRTPFINEKGEEKSSDHWIMVLKHNPGFLEKYGESIRQITQKTFGSLYQLPDANQVSLMPMEDHVPTKMLEHAGSDGVALDPAEAFVADANVSSLIDKLASLRNKQVTHKDKLMSAKAWLHKNPGGTLEMLAAHLETEVGKLVTTSTSSGGGGSSASASASATSEPLTGGLV